MNLYWKNLSLKRKVAGKLKGYYYSWLGKLQAGKKWNPKIASIEVTLEKIIKDKSSVSRYGDGEYKWMAGIPQNSFQNSSKEMAERLQEIIKSEEKNHLVCLSDGFSKLNYLNSEAQGFWYHFMGEHRKRWIAFLKSGKQYYNTNMTRPYMDYLDKTPCKHRFDLLKEIWKNRDVILIEGKKSRLGIGNDLFSEAKSIKRILAPAMNAYDKYNEIFQTAMEQDKEALYLIALGPTATILAYDLYKSGRQAIDVGHVDIEYEWFLRGAGRKIRIPNKYVNEVNAGNGVEENLEDEKYQSQIVARIELGESGKREV
ncbi:MAG: SP_1767 family glycosyltransferase [Lachnospiraceae bacterium]|nr:SP_1767 family glycosyltransferase [Lachnospiraceae bacterium]